LKRILALPATGMLAALALAPTAASAQPVAGPTGSIAPLADPIRNCGPAPADKDPSAWGRPFSGTVNMRRSPSAGSTQICGQAQASHRADYHCFTSGEGGTWTYLRDVETTFAGWVRDDLLSDGGSFVLC
jgi:hypothetical protein